MQRCLVVAALAAACGDNSAPERDLAPQVFTNWHGLRVPNAADGTPFMEGDVQVEAGLYAPIVVRDDIAIDVAADRGFVLDDVKLESTGKLSERTDNLDLMLGRQGNACSRYWAGMTAASPMPHVERT
jgi:hypothetical protein